jgi:hypothetical protein
MDLSRPDLFNQHARDTPAPAWDWLAAGAPAEGRTA